MWKVRHYQQQHDTLFETNSRFFRRWSLGLTVFVFFSLSGSALAATYNVTKILDTNDGSCDPIDCSLREAIGSANATGDDDTITFDQAVFATPQTITLTGSALNITNNGKLSINGADRLSVSANNLSRVFNISIGADVTISSLTVSKGNFPGGNFSGGGGILNNGTLIINMLTITDNSASGGGGGGGIFNELSGVLTVQNSTLSNNAGLTGGGIANWGTATILNTTVSTNSSQFDGGGIVNNGSLILTNTTVAGNTANTRGGGTSQLGGTLSARNSIIAGNSAPSSTDIYGTLTSLGYVLIGNTSGTVITGDTATNITNQNARLAPLGFYGGSTQTRALLAASPAIDPASSNSAPATDQRGASRIATADIGAFELNNMANGGTFIAIVTTGRKNSAYNFRITENSASFAYSVSAGMLPNGLALASSVAPNAIVALTGTPTESGLFDFSITATDGSDSTTTDYRLQILEPSAAAISISGRVYGSDGFGLNKAVVQLIDKNGSVRQSNTSAFGYFQFENVQAGESYVISVTSKRYFFASRTITVYGELTDVDFYPFSENRPAGILEFMKNKLVTSEADAAGGYFC